MSTVGIKVGVKGRTLPSGGEAGQILQKNSDKDFDTIWTTPAGGASANIPQAATTLPLSDTNGGSVGSGVSFARSDHQHQLNFANSGTPHKDSGNGSRGSGTTYSRFDHEHPENDYPNGFASSGNIILTEEVHIFDSVEELPEAGTAGRIAFVKVG